VPVLRWIHEIFFTFRGRLSKVQAGGRIFVFSFGCLAIFVAITPSSELFAETGPTASVLGVTLNAIISFAVFWAFISMAIRIKHDEGGSFRIDPKRMGKSFLLTLASFGILHLKAKSSARKTQNEHGMRPTWLFGRGRSANVSIDDENEPRKVPVEDIYALIREELSYRGELYTDIDICAAAGVIGDDVEMFLEEFMKRFAVDMSAFNYAYHYQAEGFNSGFGAEFGHEYIPLTPVLLKEAANKRAWAIEYPLPEENAIWRWRPPSSVLWRAVLALAALGVFWAALT
jgi:hypothetical protein